ncbi:deoxyguanosinetriphosphate triphosphohydrolase [Gephyromycinifex aptenodytis]|uniref:deoxyguanosinetriphosphate triphosphohydrolase n=1 Tax=Gephyromycinifex aptenodytis TaxID=2716227 RepID=UPI001D02A342|nr:deoxyguanosinetriphosphate triphosphohydrolase [Gephyromycinifex aptenodytis]
MEGYSIHDRARWVGEDPAQKRTDRHDFARDRARVLHCSGLRRLAAKTQVVRPDSGDFARNRLTHSLEVAQIGREFGAALGCDADLVDTACLSHDLGHPPFGHNGESALALACADIGGFEGNAQTLRLLTRLEAKRFHPDGRSAGLNLTRASLDAATKYPWPAAQAPQGSAKFGVYEDDLEVFTWLRDGVTTARRCIEAQVMDWSDDIAYSVHDVEDAVASGELDLRVLTSPVDLVPVFDTARRWYVPQAEDAMLEAAVDRLLRSGQMAQGYDGSRAGQAALKDMTSRLIGRFVLASEKATRAVHGPGPLIRHNADLVVPEQARTEVAVLKALAAHFVMLSPARMSVRENEHAVITGLLEAFSEVPERLDPVHRADLAQARSQAEARRVIVDQVASLSDLRALSLYDTWWR